MAKQLHLCCYCGHEVWVPLQPEASTLPVQADRQTGRQTDRQTDRQKDRQTDKKAGRKADRQKIRQIVYALPLQENLGTGCTLGNIHTDKDTE